MKNTMIARANRIAEASKKIASSNTYKVVANDWTKGDNDRTYISIVETTEGTRHYRKYDCGYINNITGEYISGKNINLNDDYTVDGRRF